MEKLKVSKETSRALEILINNNISNYNIAKGFSGDKPFHHLENSVALKTIQHNIKDVDVLYSILLNGYEVDLSKEELVMEKFQEKIRIANTSGSSDLRWYSVGFNEGVEYMNDLFELGLNLQKK